MIDNHPKEQEAMALFISGENKKAHRLQETFLEEVKKSGEDHCSCTAKCKYHGRCVDCVIIHRGHGEHLPFCFHDMVNKRLEGISALTEHSIKKLDK